TGSLWLFGWMLGQLFPSPPSSSDTFTFTAPSPARTSVASYDASVADGRGGGAHGRQYVTVSPASNPGQPPSGTLSTSVTGPDAQGNYTVTVNFPVTDPEGSTTAWDYWVGHQNGASGTCCFTGPSASFQATAGA